MWASFNAGAQDAGSVAALDLSNVTLNNRSWMSRDCLYCGW